MKNSSPPVSASAIFRQLLDVAQDIRGVAQKPLPPGVADELRELSVDVELLGSKVLSLQPSSSPVANRGNQS